MAVHKNVKMVRLGEKNMLLLGQSSDETITWVVMFLLL